MGDRRHWLEGGLIAGLGAEVIRLHYGKQLRSWWKKWKQKPKRERQLHPRTPEDCPFCQAYEPERPTRSHAVRPWGEVKSRVGRPKLYDSEGYWCDNPACEYYGVTEAGIHALVSDGWRGKTERIQRRRCAACGNPFSARRHTPLYRVKTPSRRVAEVMTAMAEGVDTAAASRIFNHHPKTIAHWVRRGGQHGRRLHEHYFRQMRSGHLQVDELVTKVRGYAERVWVWTGTDAQNKVLLALHLGQRTREDGHALVHEVQQRLAPEQLPVFSSDGFQQYFYALTAHFGHWREVPGKRRPVWEVDERLLYGQVHKVRSGYRLKRMYSRIRWGTREEYRAQLQALGFTGKVQTAYVERLNLTLRELVAPLFAMGELRLSPEDLTVSSARNQDYGEDGRLILRLNPAVSFPNWPSNGPLPNYHPFPTARPRSVQTRHEGHIWAGGVEKDVTFVEVDDSDLNDQIDAAYLTKYRRYPQYVAPLVTSDVRAATIKLVPH